MVLIILIVITIAILWLARSSQPHREQKKLQNREWTKEDADTLITTVLPTINNDELKK